MTARVWESAKNLTLNLEGKFQNNPNDKGNWTGGAVGKGLLKGTNFGISAATFPYEDIQNITKERAEYLYKKMYWDKSKCDFLPDCLSVAVFDYAINSGVPKAIKDLQRSLYVKVDGIIGNQTIGAANRLNPRKVLERYINLRLSLIADIIKRDPKQKRFEKGWTDRIEKTRKFCEELI